MRRAHWMWVGLEAAPTALGVGELVGAFLSGVLDVPPGGDLMFRVCAAPVFVLILGVGTVVRRGWRSSWRVPCLVAPLALLFPLTPVSTMFGTGFAGIQLFVDGLVSMDPKVVSGFGAVLGTALIRVVHAVAAVRWPDRRVLAAVLVVGVGSWLPVAWVLDRSLLGELYSWEMSVFVLRGRRSGPSRWLR